MKYREWLIIEYNTLISWASAAGVIENDTGEKIAISLGADPLEMLAHVSRIEKLLLGFLELNARWSELHPKEGISAQDREAARVEASKEDITVRISTLTLEYEKGKEKRMHSVKKNMSAFRTAMTELAKHPKRLRWVLWDEDVFKSLLEELHIHTERLKDLLDDHRSAKQLNILSKMHLEMVQDRKSTQELHHVLRATTLMAEYATKPKGAQEPRRNANDILRDMVRLKYLNVPVEQLDEEEIQKSHFAFSDDLHIVGDANREGRTPAILKVGGIQKAVWIEWKPYKMNFLEDDDDEDAKIHPATRKRTAALARMLHIQKPDSFSTPHCLGFFDDRKRDRSKHRFGWMFEMPQPDTVTKGIVSLFDIMENPATTRPSLNIRVALASNLACTLFYMHAVDWLHKAIRSDNVVFASDGDQPDLNKPVLSGFEYSRPTGKSHTSERAEPIAVRDLYRWPGIQGQDVTDPRSRKTYDIYALGLVLLEIAYWQPLYKILQLKRQTIGFKAANRVRDDLLNSETSPLKNLQNLVGNGYYNVVHRCIVAHEDDGSAFNVREDEDQTKSTVGLKLHEAFLKEVVEVLQGICV
jgi:energy-converting hydrogenase A subunit M